MNERHPVDETAAQILRDFLREQKAPLKVWGALKAMEKGNGDKPFRWPRKGDSIWRGQNSGDDVDV